MVSERVDNFNFRAMVLWDMELLGYGTSDYGAMELSKTGRCLYFFIIEFPINSEVSRINGLLKYLPSLLQKMRDVLS